MDKCKLLQLGNSSPANYYLSSPDGFFRSLICKVTEEKDLGVYCTSDMKPSLQVQKAVTKAMQTLGMLKRSFKFLSRELFLFLYRTYIRPHLEYCAPSWSPYLVKDIDALERVQHRATKLVKSLSTLTCEDRLASLQLQSLYCCRQRGDLIEAFKILNDFTNIQMGTAFTLNTTQFTRGHPFKLVKSRCNLKLRRHFFTNRVVNQWHSLSSYVVCAPTVNSFKLKLDNYWNSIKYGQNQRPMAY